MWGWETRRNSDHRGQKQVKLEKIAFNRRPQRAVVDVGCEEKGQRLLVHTGSESEIARSAALSEGGERRRHSALRLIEKTCPELFSGKLLPRQ